MPTVGDFYDSVTHIETYTNEMDTKLNKLDTIITAVHGVHDAVVDVNKTLTNLLGQMISLTTYLAQAAYHNSLQNDTIICILEHISQNTCLILNETHTQTGLQAKIERSSKNLEEMFATSHAAAALERERLEKLRAQIEECCPPKPVPPVCVYEPCPAPRRLTEPRIPDRPHIG